MINREIGKVDTISVVNGESYADALSVANIVKNKGRSILLTNNSNSDELRKSINNKKQLYFVGGENTISQSNIDKILK